MFPNHVHPKVLQDLQVEDQRFQSRSQVDAIGPEALVERADLEEELAVQKRPLHTVDDAGLDGAEAGVAGDDIVAQLHRDVVEGRRVGRPEVGGVDAEVEGGAGGAFGGGDHVAVAQHGELDRQRLVGGAVHRDIDLSRVSNLEAKTGGSWGSYRCRPRQPQRPIG